MDNIVETMKTLCDNRGAVIGQMAQAHFDEVARLQREHAKEMTKLKAGHEKAIVSLSARKEAVIKGLERRIRSMESEQLVTSLNPLCKVYAYNT